MGNTMGPICVDCDYFAFSFIHGGPYIGYSTIIWGVLWGSYALVYGVYRSLV